MGRTCLPMFYACNFQGNSVNNHLSYCGLIDAKIRASDKDLSVSEPISVVIKDFLPYSFLQKSRNYLSSCMRIC